MIKGLIAPILTPFDDQLAVDQEKFNALAQQLLAQKPQLCALRLFSLRRQRFAVHPPQLPCVWPLLKASSLWVKGDKCLRPGE